MAESPSPSEHIKSIASTLDGYGFSRVYDAKFAPKGANCFRDENGIEIAVWQLESGVFKVDVVLPVQGITADQPCFWRFRKENGRLRYLQETSDLDAINFPEIISNAKALLEHIKSGTTKAFMTLAEAKVNGREQRISLITGAVRGMIAALCAAIASDLSSEHQIEQISTQIIEWLEFALPWGIVIGGFSQYFFDESQGKFDGPDIPKSTNSSE